MSKVRGKEKKDKKDSTVNVRDDAAVNGIVRAYIPPLL